MNTKQGGYIITELYLVVYIGFAERGRRTMTEKVRVKGAPGYLSSVAGGVEAEREYTSVKSEDTRNKKKKQKKSKKGMKLNAKKRKKGIKYWKYCSCTLTMSQL